MFTSGCTQSSDTGTLSTAESSVSVASTVSAEAGTAAFSPFDPETDSYIKEGTPVQDGVTSEENTNASLSVPTIIKRIGNTWFLVDCYHNRVLYLSGDETVLSTPVSDWSVLPTEGLSQPHTVAGDGEVLLVDDTENNRVLVYTIEDTRWIHTQTFTDIGNRPHFSVYDPDTDTFYVLSSESGELYCFRHAKKDPSVYLTDIRSCPELAHTYVRSFTLLGDEILFVSGISTIGDAPRILLCRLSDLSVLASFSVDDAYAGMVQILPVEDDALLSEKENTAGKTAKAAAEGDTSDNSVDLSGSGRVIGPDILHTKENFSSNASSYFVTISTDLLGSQDVATMLQISGLSDLSSGSASNSIPEDIYSRFFIGGGTPYYMTFIDGRYYLTEHRLPGHSLWSFAVQDGEISDVKAIY